MQTAAAGQGKLISSGSRVRSFSFFVILCSSTAGRHSEGISLMFIVMNGGAFIFGRVGDHLAPSLTWSTQMNIFFLSAFVCDELACSAGGGK